MVLQSPRILSAETESKSDGRKFLSLLNVAPPPNKILKLTGNAIDTSFSAPSVLLAGLQPKKRRTTPLTRADSCLNKRADEMTEDVTSEDLGQKAIFEDKTFALEFSSKCSFKEKQRAKEDVKTYGGTISHILNKKVTAVIAWDESSKETYKCRRAVELSIPVLSFNYITDSIQAGEAKDVDEYIILGVKRLQQLQSGKIADKSKGSGSRLSIPTTVDWRRFELLPPSSTRYIVDGDRYSVPKWAFLASKADGEKLCVVEVHVNFTESRKKEFRVMTLQYQNGFSTSQEIREANSALQAELLFSSVYSYYEGSLKYRKLDKIPSQRGSVKLQQTLFSWTIDEVVLSADTSYFIDMVWDEAVGELEKNLTITGENISSASLANVEQAEAVLLEMKSCLASGDSITQLSDEYYDILPHKSETPIRSLRDISRHLDILQLLYDLLSVGEATDWQLKATTKNKLRLLNCHISECGVDQLTDQPWSASLTQFLATSENIKVDGVFEISRPSEQLLKNGRETKLLFHASRPENYLGILSRGLLLPKHVVDDIGGKRTDAGNLGQGIYFADDFKTSHDYTTSFSTNSRLMLVCEVVTGTPFFTTQRMPDLVEPPEGYDSVMACGQTASTSSQFQDNEYCVYNTNHQVLRYVIRYTTVEDRERGIRLPPIIPNASEEEPEAVDAKSSDPEDITDDISSRKDVLADVLPGLQVEGSEEDEPIPLRSIHVIASLVDVAAEVTVLQEYLNTSSEPIEAKFVFPLSDLAAVCGFEAYINDKHIIGKVKEKETAQREYRKAVSEGHGAYLMVQDKERPDVFTVSVGNLPPAAKVLIKIIYVCELAVQDEKFVFELPTNLAPWKARQALAEKTQSTVDKVDVGSGALEDVKCSLQVLIQMPFDIREIECPTHKILRKCTATQAVIRMKHGQSLDNGFQLTVSLAEIHVPRMIIENHPDDPDSKQACMLTFYPEFECESHDGYEMIILLDLSNSMSSEDLLSAKKIALYVLTSLGKYVLFNVVTFGSTYSELFSKSVQATNANVQRAISYIRTCGSRHGNTNLLTPLTNLSMLADASRHRNVVVISDGYMTSPNLTLQAVSGMYGAVRLFTLSVSLNANKYLMRELARVGSGVSEYMNPKSKSKWSRQIEAVLAKAGQPLLSHVEVVWQEQNADLPTPLQAPACIPSVFNGNRIVVYGFASNCYMARLKALIDGREVSMVVSASPLMASTGLTVHRLAARSVIQDWEHGCLSSDTIEHATKKKKLKASIIEMSKEYSIITQFTSFVAVEERKEGEFASDLPPAGPSINELISDHRMDTLSYMRFEEDPYTTGTRKLTLKTLAGKSFVLTVTSTMTVKDLKAEVEHVEGIRPSQSRLIARGRQMEDEHLLDEYDLFTTDEDPTVHIILRLRGGYSPSSGEVTKEEVEERYDGLSSSDGEELYGDACGETSSDEDEKFYQEASVKTIKSFEFPECLDDVAIYEDVQPKSEETRPHSEVLRVVHDGRMALQADGLHYDVNEMDEMYDYMEVDNVEEEEEDQDEEEPQYMYGFEREHLVHEKVKEVHDECSNFSQKSSSDSDRDRSAGEDLDRDRSAGEDLDRDRSAEEDLDGDRSAGEDLDGDRSAGEDLDWSEEDSHDIEAYEQKGIADDGMVKASSTLCERPSRNARFANEGRYDGSSIEVKYKPQALSRISLMHKKKKKQVSAGVPFSKQDTAKLTSFAASPSYSPTSPGFSPTSPKNLNEAVEEAPRLLNTGYVTDSQPVGFSFGSIPASPHRSVSGHSGFSPLLSRGAAEPLFESNASTFASDSTIHGSAAIRNTSSSTFDFGAVPPSLTTAFGAIPTRNISNIPFGAPQSSTTLNSASYASSTTWFGAASTLPQSTAPFGATTTLSASPFKAAPPPPGSPFSSATTPAAQSSLFNSLSAYAQFGSARGSVSASTFDSGAPPGAPPPPTFPPGSSAFGSHAPQAFNSGFVSSAPHSSRSGFGSTPFPPPPPKALGLTDKQGLRLGSESFEPAASQAQQMRSTTGFSVNSPSVLPSKRSTRRYAHPLALPPTLDDFPPLAPRASRTSKPLPAFSQQICDDVPPSVEPVGQFMNIRATMNQTPQEKHALLEELAPQPLQRRPAAHKEILRSSVLSQSLNFEAERSRSRAAMLELGSLRHELVNAITKGSGMAHDSPPPPITSPRVSLLSGVILHSAPSPRRRLTSARLTLGLTANRRLDSSLPGIFSVSKTGELSLVIDYRSLTDFQWNSNIHVIANTEWREMSSAPARICYSEEGEGRYELVFKLQKWLNGMIQGFDYRSLELILVKAGVLSMGKTAALEIFCLFLWKMAIFRQHIDGMIKNPPEEQRPDEGPAVKLSVEELIQFLDSKSLDNKPSGNFKYGFSGIPETENQTYCQLVKRYPMILTTLEFGKSWANILINMLSDEKSHQLKVGSFF